MTNKIFKQDFKNNYIQDHVNLCMMNTKKVTRSSGNIPLQLTVKILQESVKTCQPILCEARSCHILASNFEQGIAIRRYHFCTLKITCQMVSLMFPRPPDSDIHYYKVLDPPLVASKYGKLFPKHNNSYQSYYSFKEYTVIFSDSTHKFQRFIIQR